MRWKRFLSASSIRVELIRQTWCCVFVRTVQGLFSSSWISSKTSRPMPQTDSSASLPPRNWNHQHWSKTTFNDDSRASLCHSVHRAWEFHLFPGCNNPLALQQNDEKLGHAHYRCRDWLWTHQQIAHETCADDYSSGACVPTCCGIGDGG